MDELDPMWASWFPMDDPDELMFDAGMALDGCFEDDQAPPTDCIGEHSATTLPGRPKRSGSQDSSAVLPTEPSLLDAPLGLFCSGKPPAPPQIDYSLEEAVPALNVGAEATQVLGQIGPNNDHAALLDQVCATTDTPQANHDGAYLTQEQLQALTGFVDLMTDSASIDGDMVSLSRSVAYSNSGAASGILRPTSADATSGINDPNHEYDVEFEQITNSAVTQTLEKLGATIADVPQETDVEAHRTWWVNALVTAMRNVDDVLDGLTERGKPTQAVEAMRRGGKYTIMIQNAARNQYELVRHRQSLGPINFDAQSKPHKVEQYASLDMRLFMVARILFMHKAVCKHLLDVPFPQRFANAPFHELRIKLKNKQLNEKRDKETTAGRAVLKQHPLSEVIYRLSVEEEQELEACRRKSRSSSAGRRGSALLHRDSTGIRMTASPIVKTGGVARSGLRGGLSVLDVATRAHSSQSE